MLFDLSMKSVSFKVDDVIEINVINVIQKEDEKDVFNNCNYLIEIIRYDKINREIPIYSQSHHLQGYKEKVIFIIESLVLKPGLYGIKFISVFDIEDQSKNFSIYLNLDFYISKENEPIKTHDEIFMIKQSILTYNDNYYYTGIGRIYETNIELFEIFVFCTDIMVERSSRIGKVDVIPHINLTVDNVLDNMKDFAAKLEIEKLQSKVVIDNSKPCSVIHYVNVSAKSIEDSIMFAEQYTKVLLCAYSIHNMSYGSILGMLIYDKKNKTIEYRVKPNIYKGNLIGAFQLPVNKISKIILKGLKDPISNFYLQMYLQCANEKLTQFAYFRYWNLVESIARNKIFNNQYRTDECGDIMQNNNKPISMNNEARIIVYELIRSNFEKAEILDDLLLTSVQQNSLEDRTIVWYQRRNCIVHKGGCHYGDFNYCNRNDIKKCKCRNSYEEVYNQTNLSLDIIDYYLLDFIEICKKVILIELDCYNDDEF